MGWWAQDFKQEEGRGKSESDKKFWAWAGWPKISNRSWEEEKVKVIRSSGLGLMGPKFLTGGGKRNKQ